MRSGALIGIFCAACAGSSAGDDDDSLDVDAGDPDAAPPAFVLDVHTALADDGALILRTNLPARDLDCLAVPGAPCGDVDADGLTDAWEDIALDRLRPLQRFAEGESLLTDPGAIEGDIGRVAPTGDGAILFIVLAYSKDYGSCGVSGHNGDPERVALHVVALAGGGPGDIVVADAYTAAHENTIGDHGHVFTSAELGQLVHEPLASGDEPRWIVYPSADKHATYATLEICAGISPIPCLSETCGSTADILPAILNAGEDGARRVEDLTPIGFPGDDAWADQSFCGGQGGGTCSAKVRDKLTADPFGLL